MRTDEFVMRGQTASGGVEVLNFSGRKAGYAYKITEFELYPSTNISSTPFELFGSISAGKVTPDPINPNFNNEGLIATAMAMDNDNTAYPFSKNTILNDTFLITQNLQLTVRNTDGAAEPVNWQCRFKPVKLKGPEEAVANYKQFMISDG